MKFSLLLLSTLLFFGQSFAADDVVTLAYPGSREPGELVGAASSCISTAAADWHWRALAEKAALAIGWKTGAGKWTVQAPNEKCFSTGPADADGWREITGVVEAPAGAGKIAFMPSGCATQGA